MTLLNFSPRFRALFGEPKMYAYLDASNNVVGLSKTELTMAQAQERIPSITTIIANASSGLIAVGQETDRFPYHHRWVSGDGTSLSDYEPASAYAYYISIGTANGIVDTGRLTYEVEQSAIVPTLARIGTYGDVVTVVFDSDLSGAEETTLTAIVAAHKGNPMREWQTVVLDPVFEPVIPGSSKVVANDRPAVEIESGVTGYGAMQQTWPLAQDDDAELRVTAKFILKESGSGSTVRIAARMKSNATGADSSSAFSAADFAAVPVTYTTVGEIFEATITLDASDAEEGDALALQVGRDGANSLGAGDSDDASVAVQVIALRAEAR
jgi:hypothetical protein